MKNFFTVCAVLMFCSAFAGDKLLSPGGVSVDMSKIKIPGQGKSEGSNIFANGNFRNTRDWHPSFYVSPSPGLDRAKATKELQKLSKKTFFKAENGGTYARIETADQFADVFKNSSGSALSGFVTAFNLQAPLNAQQEFSISFRYRGKSTNPKIHHGFFITLQFKKGHKGLGAWGRYNLPLAPNWRQSEFRFKAPADTDLFSLTAGLAGTGFCEFGDIVIRKVASVPQKMHVELYTMESIDPDCFRMREKSAVAISIAPYGQKTGKWLNLYVKLPKGLDIIGCGQFLGSPRTAKIAEKVSEDASGILYRINADQLPTQAGQYHRSGTLLLKNTFSADGKKRSISYFSEDANGKTPIRTVNLIIEKAEKSPAPKRFITGGYVTTDFIFDNKDAINAFAETYASVGFNAAKTVMPPTVRSAYLKHNIKNFGILWGIADGYVFGIDSSKKSEDILFTGIDGKPFKKPDGREEFRTAICPVIIYSKSPYRENVIKPLFEDVYKKGLQDFFVINWEPYPFEFKGCFCSRCRDEFIRHSGISASEVKKVWPQEVMKVYLPQWVKFRSFQHGKVIGAVMEITDELSKKYNRKIEFAPEIHHLHAKENSNFGTQYKLDDYLDKVRYLVPWGPYLYYDYTSPVVCNIGYHLHIWNQAIFNIKYVSDRMKNGKKRPKMIALPNLQQPSKYTLTEPEAPVFEMLTYFVNGWDGAFLYFLPIGLDNRYWNSFAQANRQIAACEDYVFDGKKFNDYSIDAITPLPKNAVASWAYIKDVATVPAADTSLLQSKGYKLNDKYLFAVGNFWENGECFFKLQINGLSRAKKWHISQSDSGKYFGSFSAAELEKGVTLHVGGLRWAFYTVTPEKSPDCNIVIDQKKVASILKSRLAEITKQYNTAKAVIDGALKAKKSSSNDISNLKTIKNGNIVLAPAGQMLKITAPGYTAMLDLDHGANLTSMKSKDGTEWAHKNALGTTRIMSPGKPLIINNGFRLLGCEKMKNGSILVKMERRFTDGKHPELAALVISKNFEFAKDSVTVSETFKNGSDTGMTLALSSHNYPMAFTFKSKETGKVKMDGAVYSRSNEPWTFTIGASPVSPVLKLYEKSGKTGKINDAPAVFNVPWSKTSLTAQWDKNKTDFLVCWGTFDMECGTFEVHRKPFTLTPGGTETLRIKWNFNN